MKNTFSVRLIYHFYHNAVKAELKRRGFPKNTSRKIAKEHKIILDKIMGNADSYLDPKRIPARRQWSEDSHKRKYENDWVVDILPGNDEYDLGYDYHECGICKLCQDEGCPELAAYLCRMDYVLADIMNMKLVRTGTIAEGASCCDFRYSKPR